MTNNADIQVIKSIIVGSLPENVLDVINYDPLDCPMVNLFISSAVCQVDDQTSAQLALTFGQMTEKGLLAALQAVCCQLLESGCILRCVFKSVQLFQDILLTWLAGEAYLEAHVSGICESDGEISL